MCIIFTELDISHYNALLQVYLENEYDFDPAEFWNMLKEKNVEPNRVTFQKFISQYCSKGDIEGATAILAFMQENSQPISQVIFNSLIVGHSQAK